MSGLPRCRRPWRRFTAALIAFWCLVTSTLSSRSEAILGLQSETAPWTVSSFFDSRSPEGSSKKASPGSQPRPWVEAGGGGVVWRPPLAAPSTVNPPTPGRENSPILAGRNLCKDYRE
jgi:hypothetical protein